MLVFRGEFVERGRYARKSFAKVFRFPAGTYAEMFRSVEKASRNNAGFVFFMQELAESISVATSQMRKCNGPGLGPDGQKLISGVEEILQERAIRSEQFFRACGNLRQMIERYHTEHLGRMRPGNAEEIVQAPHSLGKRFSRKNPAAA